MDLLTFTGIGVGLVILSLGIYLATRKLVIRSMYRAAPRPQRLAEPLYEAPMPRVKTVKARAEEKAAMPGENPLLEFIEQWEEPKAKPKAKAESRAPAKKPASEIREAAPEKVDNPLLKFIEEWEEPKPKKKR
jgi:translation initiation factor IF-2